MYPESISKYMVYKLHKNLMDGDELLKKPKPLTEDMVVKHFLKKIELIDYAISIVKGFKDLIFEEDIIKQEKTIKTLIRLKETNFCLSCADGCFSDEDMLRMGINECLACWKSINVVYKEEKNWFLTDEIRNKDVRFKDLVIYNISL